MRFLLPIILIAAGIGLFALYTNGAYHGVQSLQSRVGAFDDALTKTKQLIAQRDSLLKKLATFSADDQQKLEHVLPDNVDNIRLIIDINGIAARHGLVLKGASLGAVSDSKVARNALSVGTSGDPVGSVSVGFSVSSSYDNFLAFLEDLEHSLRIVDVERISLKASQAQSNLYDISVSIRTYWLH